MYHTCPVCGYPELTDPPYLSSSMPSFDICPSCRFQFGVDDMDRHFTYNDWRKQWIDGGMIWDKGKSTPPPDWNPKKQLLNIGVKLPSG